MDSNNNHFTRSRKMVKMVMKKLPNHKEEKDKKSNKSNTKFKFETQYSNVNNGDAESDEDPWKEFNKWKVKEIENHNKRKRKEQRMEEGATSNVNDTSSEEIISSSSVSWIPSKEEGGSSGSSHFSNASISIPTQPDAKHKENITCIFSENRNNNYNLADDEFRPPEINVTSEMIKNDKYMSNSPNNTPYLEIPSLMLEAKPKENSTCISENVNTNHNLVDDELPSEINLTSEMINNDKFTSNISKATPYLEIPSLMLEAKQKNNITSISSEGRNNNHNLTDDYFGPSEINVSSEINNAKGTSNSSKRVPYLEIPSLMAEAKHDDVNCNSAENLNNNYNLADDDFGLSEINVVSEINSKDKYTSSSSRNMHIAYLETLSPMDKPISQLVTVTQDATAIGNPESYPNSHSKVTVLQNIVLKNQKKEILTKPHKKNEIIPSTGLISGLPKIVEVSHRKSRIWDKKDRCIYCQRDVTNFSRHLFRNHQETQTLPITSDVIKFRKYAVHIAEESMEELRKNCNNLEHFKKLTEAALVLTILLNRKRVGDVQYIKLDSYRQITTDTNQEECVSVLTESEKMLSSHFKRIITIGKGSKSIPVLFPRNVQTYVEALLMARENNNLIPPENPFLFALIGSKEKWADGSSTLRKYAKKCGAENPNTLTSSRLRKQIATVLQLINLNDSEKEQVASFMGHTKKTHEEFYRLPQELYQTAKIAKLLLMMDKGEGAECQGKTLEEIDIHLETLNERQDKMEHDAESDSAESTMSGKFLQQNKFDNDMSLNTDADNMNDVFSSEYGPVENLDKANRGLTKQRDKKETKKTSCRGTWNDEQKVVMKKFFRKHLKNKTAPKKHECVELMKQHPQMFKDKGWVQIKVFIYNEFRQK